MAKVAAAPKRTLRDFGANVWNPQDVRNYAQGLERLGAGIHRRGFLLPGGTHVLKVAHQGAEIANLREIRTWDAARLTPAASVFCPIVAADYREGSWLVMPKALLAREYGADVRTAHTFARAFSAAIFDLHEGNYGFLPGEKMPRITDYGMAEYSQPEKLDTLARTYRDTLASL